MGARGLTLPSAVKFECTASGSSGEVIEVASSSLLGQEGWLVGGRIRRTR